MFIKEYQKKIYMPSEIFNKYNMSTIAYFDIETTGFDKNHDRIVLISLGYYLNEEDFKIIQYFADDINEEEIILKKFNVELDTFQRWCSYNGVAFDEPFIIKKMDRYKIDFKIPREHIDLYRIIRPFYKQLGMEGCSLKSAEKFIGIHRKDEIDGAKSVQLYYEYLETHDKNLKETLMLHNYEDVLNLPQIFSIVNTIHQDDNLKREDSITKKQLSFLKYLFRKHEIDIDIDLHKMSRKSASQCIDSILKGNINENDILKIINNSY